MKDFNVIILAAGKGSRLLPLTKRNPKCMTELKGKSILSRQINLYRKLGASKIIVVCGYMHEKINEDYIIKVINNDFDSSNMVYSLMLAKDFLDGNTIISYGDIFFKADLLNNLLNNSRDIVITSDSAWKSYWSQRFDNPLEDAESFVKGKSFKVKSLGQKEKTIKNIDGQFIGLIKLSKEGCKRFISTYNSCHQNKLCKLNAWNSGRKLKLSYMTDILNYFAKQNYLFYVETIGGWVEVDDIKDLEIANRKSWI
jgi:choline kinase